MQAIFPKVLLRPAEAADALGISRSRLYQLIKDGEIPSVAIGRSRRIRPEALAAWVDRHAEGVSDAVNGPR